MQQTIDAQSQRTPTAWVVWLYISLYAAILILQTQVLFKLPISGATYGLFFVVGGYTGMDQFATFVASKKLPAGVKYTGSYDKLLRLVIGMFALVALSIVIQGMQPQYEIPVDDVAAAAGLVAGLFAGGNKAANAAEKQGAENAA